MDGCCARASASSALARNCWTTLEASSRAAGLVRAPGGITVQHVVWATAIPTSSKAAGQESPIRAFLGMKSPAGGCARDWSHRLDDGVNQYLDAPQYQRSVDLLSFLWCDPPRKLRRCVMSCSHRTSAGSIRNE